MLTTPRIPDLFACVKTLVKMPKPWHRGDFRSSISGGRWWIRLKTTRWPCVTRAASAGKTWSTPSDVRPTIPARYSWRCTVLRNAGTTTPKCDRAKCCSSRPSIRSMVAAIPAVFTVRFNCPTPRPMPNPGKVSRPGHSFFTAEPRYGRIANR